MNDFTGTDLHTVVFVVISFGIHGLKKFVHGHQWHIRATLVPVLMRAAHL